MVYFPHSSPTPTLRPIPDSSPAQPSQRDTNAARAGAGVVPAMQPRHEFLHGPRAVALRGRQGAHECLDLVGQGGVALDAAVSQPLALCSADVPVTGLLTAPRPFALEAI